MKKKKKRKKRKKTKAQRNLSPLKNKNVLISWWFQSKSKSQGNKTIQFFNG